MNITTDWQNIRLHCSKSFVSSLHLAIASIDKDGAPTNTPIGSLFLNKTPASGFYFEKFPKKLPANAQKQNKICVLAVRSNKLFWIKSLFRLEFRSSPAIKLYGELGIIRKATPMEMRALRRRMRFMRLSQGYKYLWGNMTQVREVHFVRAEKVNLGKMTASL